MGGQTPSVKILIKRAAEMLD